MWFWFKNSNVSFSVGYNGVEFGFIMNIFLNNLESDFEIVIDVLKFILNPSVILLLLHHKQKLP
jgi:hypothetical protein